MEEKTFREFEVGGHKFIINRLPATSALDLLAEVFQGVGPSLGSLIEKVNLPALIAARVAGKPMSDVVMTLDLTGLGEMVRKFAMALGKKELRSIAAQALASTVCATQGGKLVWEPKAPLVDALNLTARQTLELIWAAVDWNLGDFWSGLVGNVEK